MPNKPAHFVRKATNDLVECTCGYAGTEAAFLAHIEKMRKEIRASR